MWISYWTFPYNPIFAADMSDDKDSDERYQIDINDEEIVTNDIEVLKLGKLGSQKNIDNIEK